jgi:hypothetical protein
MILSLQSFSQAIYPVTVGNLQVKPSVFLSDYAEPGSRSISATLIFNDLNEVSREVYLRLSIESSAVKIVTSPNFKPTPVTLYVREPLVLQTEDFAAYFNLNHLDCQGISKIELQRTGQLPEGWYTFSIEVLEFPTGKVISRKTSTRIRLELKEPPRLTFPKRGDLVKSNVQQFNFQFMHPDPDINAGNTSYVLRLFEIDDSERQPQLSIINRTAREIFASDPFRILTYNYDLSHPQLTPGKRYAYTITAFDDGGKPRFKNGGESEVFWFYFGYPTGGNIRLTSPENFVFYSRFDIPTLYWDACDNILDLSQPVVYHCKVVIIDDDETDLASAMENNPVFMERRTPEKFDKRGDFMRTSPLGQRRFAWQVRAESDGAEIGRSEIRVFTGPPLIESFFIENHEVILTAISNTDFNRFAGEGKFKIDANGRMQKVKFENLKLVFNDGIYTCESGVILCAAEGFPNIELTPEQGFESNQKAIFKADSIRLGTDGLKLKGTITWNFPLGMKTGKPELVSAETWVIFTDYQLLGQFFLPSEKRMELLEPAFFTMVLDQSSSFSVYDRIWSLNFSGHMEVNENLKGKESTTYRFPFYRLNQLYYNEISYYNPLEHIRLLKGADIFLEPKKIVLDLSDANSPGKFSTDKSWKGIYLKDFDLHFVSNVDQSGQLKSFNGERLSYQQTEFDSTTAHIIGNGLNLTVFENFTQTDPVRFYTFESRLNNFNLDIKAGFFRNGVFRGDVIIPIISEQERFRWQLPLSDNGFSQGYLDELVNRFNFTFAKDQPESRLNVTVRRIMFKNLDHLSCDLEIEFPYINTTFTDLNDFRIYGNKEIGFGKSEGVLPLTHRRQTAYKGFDISLTSIGAGRMCHDYAFGFRADIAMGDDVSGGDGAPAMNLFSNAFNSHLTEPCNKSVKEISTPELYANQGTFEMSDEGIGEDDGKSIAEEIEAQNAAMQEQIALSEALMNAFDDDMEVDIVIEYETVGKLFNDSSEYNYAEIELLELPEIDDGSLTLEDVVNILQVCLLFANEEQSRKIEGIIDQIRELESSELYDFYTRLKNGTLIRDIVNSKVTQLVVYLTSPITSACDDAKEFVNKQILTARNTVFKHFNDLLNTAFLPIEKNVKEALQAYPDLQELSVDAIKTTRSAIQSNIESAITSSIDENILGVINEFIDVSVKGRIVGFVDSTIRRNVNYIISGQAKSISFDNIKDDAKETLKGLGDDAKEFFSLETLRAMLVNTGNDILDGISWQEIQSEIVSQLTNSAMGKITDAVAGAALGALNNALGGQGSAVIESISLGFGFVNRSKTDPIRVVFKSPVADGEGYVQLDENDPIYGKVWRGHINATVKKPVPFDAFVTYINGQTLGEESFKYWFLEFGVSKLSIPLSPLPLYFTAGSGRVYQRMNRTDMFSPYMPDISIKFGAGIAASFVDQSKGAVLALDVDLGLKLMDKDFELRMEGLANIANKIKSDGQTIEKSLITGTGSMVYSSIDKSFYANASVTMNTAPLLCAGGEFKAFITPDDWGLSVGTREHPMQAKLLCRDFAKMGGWFEINKSFLDLGLFQHIYINPKSPWIGPRACQVQAWAEFGYSFGLNTLVYWKPLKIKEAAVWLDVVMGVGANYRTPLKNGSITFARINFGGNLLYVSEPDAILSGKLYGRLQVLGIKINVEMQAEKKFS